MSFFPLRFLTYGAMLMVATLLLACTQKTSAEGEVVPVTPRGYFSLDDIPDSLALSPSPPEPGSIWARLDDVVATNALTLRGSARFEQALIDAEIRFPASVAPFACALGVTVDPEHTPTLARLLERTRVDVGATTRVVKRHYQRPRPFMKNGQPTCSPEHEDLMRDNGSYPSGHTAAGWVWGLILAEIAPDRATALLLRARSYGQSRVVCNVHWYSDVVQGQALAAVVVAKLHERAEFIDDLAKAREEFTAAKARALPPPHDCDAEATALATPVVEIR